MNIQRIHGKLEKTVGSSKANMFGFVLMLGTFLISLAYLLLDGPGSYVEGVMLGSSAVLSVVTLLWYFEAKIKEDDAEIAALHAEADRAEAELEDAILDIELQINNRNGGRP